MYSQGLVRHSKAAWLLQQMPALHRVRQTLRATQVQTRLCKHIARPLQKATTNKISQAVGIPRRYLRRTSKSSKACRLTAAKLTRQRRSLSQTTWFTRVKHGKCTQDVDIAINLQIHATNMPVCMLQGENLLFAFV